MKQPEARDNPMQEALSSLLPREEVTAINVDSRGRRLIDTKEQQQARDFEMRKIEASRIIAAPRGGRLTNEKEIRERASAWNNPDNFSRDEITESLKDYYGGQGHRVSLATSQRQRRREFGEYDETDGGRRFGTHGGGDVRRHGPPPPIPPKNPARSASNASGSPQVTTLSAGTVKPVVGTAKLVAKSPEEVFEEFILANVDKQGKIVGPARAVLAYEHAANPGADAVKYVQDHPDRKVDIFVARMYLVADMTKIIERGDAEETMEYLKSHPDHVWLYELTRKKIVDECTEMANSADILKAAGYCNSHPNRQWMIVSARKAARAKLRENESDQA